MGSNRTAECSIDHEGNHRFAFGSELALDSERLEAELSCRLKDGVVQGPGAIVEGHDRRSRARRFASRTSSSGGSPHSPGVRAGTMTASTSSPRTLTFA
jgi:hypothetical protein